MTDTTNKTSSCSVIGSGGVRLAMDTFGDSEDVPVILLHGGGQTRHAWKSTAKLLASRDYYVLSLDLRGHGDSDWSLNADYSINAFADDLRCVLAKLDRPSILVGASLGGLASLLVSGEGPKKNIRALILVDITPRPASAGAARVKSFMAAHRDGFTNLDEAANAVSRHLPGRPRPSDPTGLMKNLRKRGGRLYWHWDPSFMQSINIDEEARWRRLSRAARAVSVPTLLVRGKNSELVQSEEVEEFLTLIPGADVMEVPDAGHMVAGDNNMIFGQVILDYLAAKQLS